MTARHASETEASPFSPGATPPPSNGGVLLALFLAATLVAVGGGVVYYRGESAEVYDDEARQLEVISQLKHRQLESWRAERLGDAAVLQSRNSQSRPLIDVLRGGDDPATAASIRAWLGSYLDAYHHYDQSFLIAQDGSVRLSAPGSGAAPATALLDAAARAVRTRQVELLDFFVDEHDGRPHLGLVAPVVDPAAGTAVGAIVLRIDPSAELYAVLEIERANSRTGETELVRVDGERVLFLNPLRFERDSALVLRAPTADARRLAAQAANGQVGLVRGIDYRNEEVLGFITPVSHSPWILVTRIDVAEVNAELRSHLWLVTTGVTLLVFSAGAILGLLRHNQRTQAIARHAELAFRLEGSEERLRLALSSASQGLYDLDVSIGAVIVSPEYATMLGHDPATFVETLAGWEARLHPDDHGPVTAALRDYLAGRTSSYQTEFRLRTADGGWKWLLSVGRVVARDVSGQPTRMIGTHTDITLRKEAERSAARLSTLYLTLNRCNQAIVRSSSPQELYDEICRATVESGGFDLAWIGLVDPASLDVDRVAAHGIGISYLDNLPMSAHPDSRFSTGVTGTAIREHRLSHIEDLAHDPRSAAWHDRVRTQGWCGAVAVPLLREGDAIGALTIYSKTRGAFDDATRGLLVEMAADLGFALDVMARDARRQQAEQRLRQSEARYRTLFAESGVPMLLVDHLTGDITDANTAAAEFYGFDVFALRRMHLRDLNTLPADQLGFRLAALGAGRRMRVNAQHRLASGELRDVEVFTASLIVDDQPRTLAIVSDVTARNQAEAALVEKDFQLTEAQRIAHLGNWTRRPDGSGSWSKEMYRLVGLSPEGPTPTVEQLSAQIHPNDQALVRRAQAAHQLGVPVGDLAFRAVLPDGTVRYLLERGERRVDANGRYYAAGTVQDVTERTVTEQALHRSEERLRLALGAARQGLWDLDLTSGRAVVSPPNLSSPGFSDEVAELNAQQFLASFHPADRDRIGNSFRTYASTAASSFEEEFRLLLPDGQVRWVHSAGRIVERDRGSRALRVVGVVTDITERHAFLEALSLRDRAIESSQSAIAIGDLDGQITYVNRAFLDMWGIGEAADVLGRSAVDLWAEPQKMRGVLEEMNARHCPWFGELQAVTSSGTRRDVLMSAAFVTDQRDQPIGLVAAFVDITDRKLSELAVAASLREKEALLREVHHRVKNNLQVISSLLRLELGRAADPGVRLVLGEMQNRILSMALLHETLYRSDDLSHVDLSNYLNRLVQQLFRSAAPPDGRIALQVSFAPAALDLEQAVPCGLLVTELISNSLKHGFPDNRHGEVRVVLSPVDDGPALRLAVSDTGIGLPADFAARSMQSLGLQLVSDLARQLRGTLSTGPGPGASFTLTFTPRVASPARTLGERVG